MSVPKVSVSCRACGAFLVMQFAPRRVHSPSTSSRCVRCHPPSRALRLPLLQRMCQVSALVCAQLPRWHCACVGSDGTPSQCLPSLSRYRPLATLTGQHHPWKTALCCPALVPRATVAPRWLHWRDLCRALLPAGELVGVVSAWVWCCPLLGAAVVSVDLDTFPSLCLGCAPHGARVSCCATCSYHTSVPVFLIYTLLGVVAQVMTSVQPWIWPSGLTRRRG
jgi:hypothetical protein